MFGRSVSVVLVILVIPQSIFAEVLTFYDALFEITQEEDYVGWANRTSGVYRFVHPFGPFRSARFLSSTTGDGMVVQMQTVTNVADDASQAIDSLVKEIGERLKPFYRRFEVVLSLCNHHHRLMFFRPLFQILLALKMSFSRYSINRHMESRLSL